MAFQWDREVNHSLSIFISSISGAYFKKYVPVFLFNQKDENKHKQFEL